MKTQQSNVTVDLDGEDHTATGAGTTGELVLDDAGNQAKEKIVNEDDDPAGALPAGAVLNDDGSVTYPMRHPRTLKIRSGGQVREDRYEKLTFHRMNGADMRAVSAASKESSIVVAFSRSTRIKQVVMNALFDLMDGVDIQAAGEIIEYFFGSGRKTGRSS